MPARVTSSDLPRSFWDACTPCVGDDGRPLRWPARGVAPEHLRFFCFPTSLIERLRAETAAGGAPDGYAFTFSFTASDGAVRWGCAVTGAAGGEPGGAVTAVSVALIGDWPLIRPLLECCKALFRQLQPGGGGARRAGDALVARLGSAYALRAQLRPLATACAGRPTACCSSSSPRCSSGHSSSARRSSRS